jgi:hypothetical protein
MGCSSGVLVQSHTLFHSASVAGREIQWRHEDVRGEMTPYLGVS